MNSTRWSLGAAALTVLALSAYGCSDAATTDDDDGGASSSSSGKPKSDAGKTDAGKSSSSGGKSSSGGSSGRSSSSSSGSSTSGGSSSSGDVDTDAGPTDDGGSDAGPTDGCITITPQQWAASGTKTFDTTFLPVIPGSTENELRLGFWFDGNVVGVHDLAAGDNTNALSCKQCVDADIDNAYFFQSQGTLNVTAIGTSTVTATFSDVKMVELNAAYEPLAGGRCLTLANGSIDVRQVP